MKAKVPVQGYRAVRDEVLHRIRSGRWKPGAAVPGEIELAAEFGVARATANKAMRELVDQGYLERKRKSGTRVRSMPERAARLAIPLIREEVEAFGQYGYQLLAREVVQADAALRARLDLKTLAKLLYLLCVHTSDDAPYQVEERWINLATLPEAAEVDFSTVGPNEWLVKRVPFNDVQLEFSAILPPPHVRKLMGAGARTPCLLAERTTWLNNRSLTFLRLYSRPGHRLVTQY